MLSILKKWNFAILLVSPISESSEIGPASHSELGEARHGFRGFEGHSYSNHCEPREIH